MRTLNQIMESLERSIELKSMKKIDQEVTDWLNDEAELANCARMVAHIEQKYGPVSRSLLDELLSEYAQAFNELDKIDQVYLSQNRAPH